MFPADGSGDDGKTAARAPRASVKTRAATIRPDLGRLEIDGGDAPVATALDFERQGLPFGQGGHAGALDGTDVHEDVLSSIARLDESEAALIIEEFHCSNCHDGLRQDK